MRNNSIFEEANRVFKRDRRRRIAARLGWTVVLLLALVGVSAVIGGLATELAYHLGWR